MSNEILDFLERVRTRQPTADGPTKRGDPWLVGIGRGRWVYDALCRRRSRDRMGGKKAGAQELAGRGSTPVNQMALHRAEARWVDAW